MKVVVEPTNKNFDATKQKINSALLGSKKMANRFVVVCAHRTTMRRTRRLALRHFFNERKR